MPKSTFAKLATAYRKAEDDLARALKEETQARTIPQRQFRTKIVAAKRRRLRAVEARMNAYMRRAR